MADIINRVVLGKRLRKKIREACCLEDLAREERMERAREVIANYDIKQDICLRYPGITHKDIDRTMKSVLANKKETEESIERKAVPEKWGDDDENPRRAFTPKFKKSEMRAPTREEVQALIAKSNAPVEDKVKKEYVPPENPLTREEVAAILNGTYHPDKFKYLRKKKK